MGDWKTKRGKLKMILDHLNFVRGWILNLLEPAQEQLCVICFGSGECHDWIKGSIRKEYDASFVGYSIWHYVGFIFSLYMFYLRENIFSILFGVLELISRCTYSCTDVHKVREYFYLEESFWWWFSFIEEVCTFLLMSVLYPQKVENYVSSSSPVE